MSSVSLSAATRQNLLSLQDTAALTASTQNRLATGKKVASALDNPVNFFTAQGLTNRSSDLGALLDGISNGIQTIQAANQGLTSIQKLVDTAKSTANQALATQLTTSGTASTAFSTGDADDVNLYVNGSAITVELEADSSIDQAITKLNAAMKDAGTGNAFSKDTSGTKIVMNATAVVEFASITDQEILGFATSATDVTSDKYGDGEDVAQTGSDVTITGVKERSKLAEQYNSLLTQIDQLAQDTSYNGVNLLKSDDEAIKLHISFNEKDTTSLDIQSVDATSNGLDLKRVGSDSEEGVEDGKGNFLLDAGVKVTLASLTNASTELRSQASGFGSKLSVVQNRQDFTKNLINVLGEGASKLTDADLNEEAANSQALGVRQQLGISALSLASQAQQAVLQLLR